MNYKNIVIIHGVGGLHRESYFEHLAQHCRGLGLNVIMPSFGGYKDDITYQQWKAQADTEVLPYLGQQTILFAQSMGTNFAVKYIAERKATIGLYITAAASCQFAKSKVEHPSIDKIIGIFKQFTPLQADYNYIKGLPCKKYSFYSDNDQFTSVQVLQEYARLVGAQAILVKGAGHFDFAADVLKFAQLEDLITKSIK